MMTLWGGAHHTIAKTCPHYPASRQLFAAARPSGPLPKHLFRRGETLNFNRKLPADWRTDLLSPSGRSPPTLAQSPGEARVRESAARRGPAPVWSSR